MRAVFVCLLSCSSLACSSGEFTVAGADDSGSESAIESSTDGCATKNACGGCEKLAKAPGELCGVCGKLECNGLDATVCADRPKNPCGGCRELGGAPGDACASCGGKVVCDGVDKLKCEGDAPKNACGGCTKLDGAPGDKCGKCGAGSLSCSGTDALKCDGDTPLNKCGGCTKLANDPGTTCPCGSYACETTDSTVCKTTCLVKEACCTTSSPPKCYSTLCLSCCSTPLDASIEDASPA